MGGAARRRGVAAAESTDGWSDGVPRGKVGSSCAVLYSMCTSSYPIGLESLLDFLPWDLSAMTQASKLNFPSTIMI